jgi:hypothetical protein
MGHRDMGQMQKHNGARRRGSARAVLSIALAAALAALLLPAAAQALPYGYAFKETFGSASQPSFARPMAMTVDAASGDLLVVDVTANTISRFKANGEADNFSALGSNVIDGKGGADKTTPEGLSFGVNPGGVQVAVDASCALHSPPYAAGSLECEALDPANGDIYATQRNSHLVDVFSSEGEYLGQLTISSEGALGRTAGVAVDPSGAVYVGDQDNNKIHKYLPTSNSPFAATNTANFSRELAAAMAVGAGPTAGFVFSDNFGGGLLGKLDSTTGAEKYEISTGNFTVALNPTDGTLLSATEEEVRQYDASGATEAKLLAQFEPGGGNLRGIAVASASGDVYLTREGQTKIAVYERVPLPEAITEAASGVKGESATLHGKASALGGPPASCQFQYWPASKAPAEAQIAPCDPPGPFTGSGTEAISAEVKGLAPGSDYRFRVVATNKAGSSPENAFFNGKPSGTEGTLTFKTLGAAIAGQAISEVTETTATAIAQVNPNGEATTVAVEYVSEADYLKSGYNEATAYPVPPEGIGSGNGAIAVSLTLTGLSPGSGYHYRLVAVNGATVRGPDQRFATYPTASGLPDNRAYEKVTPTEKAGEAIPLDPGQNLGGSNTGQLPGINNIPLPAQAAPDGSSVLYSGQPFASGLAAVPNQYLSGRGGSGWGWQSLSAPNYTGYWQAFSADLGRGVIYQFDPALSPQAPSREGHAFANLYLFDGAPSLTPLIAVEPPHRGPTSVASGANLFQARFSAANAGTASAPAFTHIAFEANDGLTVAAPGTAPAAPESEAGECAVAHCDLYEWSGGQLHLVNVAPGNAAALGEAVIGSGRLLNRAVIDGGSAIEFEAPDTSNAISADGRRVFFSSGQTGQAYARLDGERTLEVPGPATCKEAVALASRACFLTASTDGSKVLLANGQTYALNEAETAYEPATDLAEAKGGFQGTLGASEDFSRIYFVDTAALPGAAGQESAIGQKPEAGKLNLYARIGGQTRFVAALVAADSGVDRYGAWKPSPAQRTAQVSDDGRFLAFMSQASLTGYDNTVAGGGKCRLKANEGPACWEVLEYDAATEKLLCASCNPTGQRPLGQSNLSLIKPGGGVEPPFRQPGNLSRAGEGRLFFESQDVLSTRDKNGAIQDVYEYEPQGVGDCTRPGGCVALISSGKSTGDSMFEDSTPSGDDAFFITREQLLASDKDQQLDLYDARVGGGFDESPPPPPCGGEAACKGASPAAPAPPTAASTTVGGPGNVIEAPKCRKGSHRVSRGGKSRCVKKKAHKRKKHKAHHKKHKRAKHHRGGRR